VCLANATVPYEVGVTLSNLALVHQRRGKPIEAEALYRRALAIKERALGDDHPEVATTLNNLATLLRSQSRYDEAAALYRRCLGIWIDAVGLDHPTTRTCQANCQLLSRRMAGI
jgi:tetratricopeptide (TPR) repeat protein